MFRKIFPIMIVILSLAAVSCSGSSDDASSDSARNAPEGVVRVEDFRLAPGDKIHLTVFNEDNITDDYEVDPEGLISVPLAGVVKAGGLRKVDLEKALADKLGSLLKDPRITISVVSFRPFYIIGEVEKPGEYQFRTGLNVISAMSIAGGSTYRANKGHVLIQRGGAGDFKEYPMLPTIKVYPGDLVKVPERFF
jgi:protein involved in polysaccharide export with SLBB domain